MPKATRLSDEPLVAVRLGVNLRARIAEHRKRLRVLLPGSTVTESMAIRALLTTALDAAEAAEKTAKK